MTSAAPACITHSRATDRYRAGTSRTIARRNGMIFMMVVLSVKWFSLKDL